MIKVTQRSDSSEINLIGIKRLHILRRRRTEQIPWEEHKPSTFITNGIQKRRRRREEEREEERGDEMDTLSISSIEETMIKYRFGFESQK